MENYKCFPAENQGSEGKVTGGYMALQNNFVPSPHPTPTHLHCGVNSLLLVSLKTQLSVPYPTSASSSLNSVLFLLHLILQNAS